MKWLEIRVISANLDTLQQKICSDLGVSVKLSWKPGPSDYQTQAKFNTCKPQWEEGETFTVNYKEPNSYLEIELIL